MVNLDRINKAAAKWTESKPFPHFIVDGFFDAEVAKTLEEEFPNFEDDLWQEYDNAIEFKKVCNNWNVFPKHTYEAFTYLNSIKFVDFISESLFGKCKLFCDTGLNGGGWHIHGRGGKLNTHLDYSLHPKLRLQRKLNLIVYLNSEWQSDWGGHLGLWDNKHSDAPGDLIKQVEPKFNRALIFDTTMNSWHGFPNPIRCPGNQMRKSMAVYYLTEPQDNVDDRGKALFAPSNEQHDNIEVLELIKKRRNIATASSVYSNKRSKNK